MIIGKIAIPWQVILCALFVFLFTTLFSFFIFDHIPRVHDEIAYLFQAQLYKSGRLYAPSSPAGKFFDFTHMINNGKWYSQYTPGHPSMLLLGLLIGAPWVVNPLLAALSIILIFLLGKEIHSRRVGMLAAFLGAISIWFLLLSSTMMSHTSCLFFVTFFLLFLFRSVKKPTVLNGLLAGIGLGGAILNRPYNAILIAFPFLIFFAVQVLKKLKIKWKNALAFVLVVVSALAGLLAYNYLTNGHPLRMGYIVSHGIDHGIGFGKKGYMEFAHTPYLGVANFFANMRALNSDLFGWPLTSFWALLPLLWWTRRRREDIKMNLLFLASFLTLSFGLFIYWGTHVFMGARMYFEIIPFFLILSAQGLDEIPPLFHRLSAKIQPHFIHKIGAVVLIGFVVYAFSVRFPRWVWPKNTQWYYDGYDNHFAGVNPGIPHALESLLDTPALVLVKFLYFPFESFPNGWWSTGFYKNDPDLKGQILYAQDRGDDNREIFDHFPGRKIYLFLGTLEKGVLIPLTKNGSQIEYGTPLCAKFNGKNPIEFVADPKELYTPYSREFEAFLQDFYARNDWAKIDVEYLFESGKQALEEGRYTFATHCLEAALQIEKSPGKRALFLNHLVSCYAKAGQGEESLKILARLEHFDAPRLYKMFPEKGF